MRIPYPLVILSLILALAYRVTGQNVDSLRGVLGDSVTFELFRKSGEQAYKDYSIDSARQLFTVAYHIVNTSAYPMHWQMVKVLKGLSAVESKAGNLDACLNYINDGIEYVDDNSLDPEYLVDFLINKGVSYHYAAQFDNALESYLAGLEKSRSLDLNRKTGMLLSNAGVIYRQMERYQEALNLYRESLPLRMKMKDSLGVANVLFNMGAAFGKMKEYEKSKEAIRKAKNWYRAIGSIDDIVLCDQSLATTLFWQDSLDAALPIYLSIYENNDVSLETDHWFNLNFFLVRIYLSKNEIQRAAFHLAQIREDVLETGMTIWRTEYHELNSEISARQSNYKEAYTSLKNYVDEAEIYSDEVNRELIKEMEEKFLTAEKDHEISMLELGQERDALKLRTARIQNLGLGLGLLVLAVFTFFIFRVNSRIKIQNEKIKKSDKEKEVLLKEIHHRVKNNLQVVSALLALQSRYVTDENALQTLQQGQDRVESMALIHKDLYQQDNLKGINTEIYLNKLIESLHNSYKQPGQVVDIQTDIDEIWLDVDTMVPLGLMINELLSNAFKYAFNEEKMGQLQILLSENEGQLKLTIKDNGEGIDATELMDAQSFGYNLVNSLARRLDANVEYLNDDGLGVTVYINDYVKVA